MRQIGIVGILFWITLTVQGQYRPASQPGYNPTVPRLIGMRHKAVSFTDQRSKITTQDFEQKQNKEDINIYVVYEKDSTLGESRGDADILNPPAKLMDLYLIYEYTYNIYCATKEEILDARIPKINLESGGFVDELKVITYYMDDKGKLKDKKVKKSSINSELTNGLLSIRLDQSQVIQNSFAQINIKIKTRNFAKLSPSISSDDHFNKSLTISYPIILKYKITDIPSLELTSSSTSQFQLLHFVRDSGAGNGHIKTLKVDSKIFTWKINTKENKNKTEFELEGLSIPSGSDIGIRPTDIVSVN